MNEHFTKNILPSLIRTYTPWAVGILVSALAKLGLNIDSDAAAGIIALVVSVLWYLIARVLEQFYPKAGAMLGWITQVIYERTGAVAPADQTVPYQTESVVIDEPVVTGD